MNCSTHSELMAEVTRDMTECGEDMDGPSYQKLLWIMDRARFYAAKIGVTTEEVISSWERSRSYWYFNHYQANRYPLFEGPAFLVDSFGEWILANGGCGFRCPSCGANSSRHYSCSACGASPRSESGWVDCPGAIISNCGPTVVIVLREIMKPMRLFMPIAWEHSNDV